MSASIVAAVVAFGVASASAQDQPEPAAQYQELSTAYSTASGAFRAAETNVQRKLAVGRFAEFPQKFIDLADNHHDDPVANGPHE